MHRQLNSLLDRDLAWVVIPEIALTASMPARTIRRGARIALWWARPDKENGAVHVRGASPLQNTKRQSLYFGPPW
jgi:hypothetical protein